MLYVAKADAYNSNIHVNIINNAGSSFNEESESYNKGPIAISAANVNEQIYKITGKENTKQLFTLVKAKIDVNKSGFTIPMPRTEHGEYKFTYTKNKKDRGTEDAVVLTRETDGAKVVNGIHKAIAYTGIVAGAAAMATAVVMGCMAAVSAATGTAAASAVVALGGAAVTAGIAAGSAALACIPFVGWAVLAAAVIAASVFLLCKVFAGEDQEFEFFAIKGPEKHPLVLPLWGEHTGYKNVNDKKKGS